MNGALVMLAFGAGTLPALLGAGMAHRPRAVARARDRPRGGSPAWRSWCSRSRASRRRSAWPIPPSAPSACRIPVCPNRSPRRAPRRRAARRRSRRRCRARRASPRNRPCSPRCPRIDVVPGHLAQVREVDDAPGRADQALDLRARGGTLLDAPRNGRPKAPAPGGRDARRGPRGPCTSGCLRARAGTASWREPSGSGNTRAGSPSARRTSASVDVPGSRRANPTVPHPATRAMSPASDASRDPIPMATPSIVGR